MGDGLLGVSATVVRTVTVGTPQSPIWIVDVLPKSVVLFVEMVLLETQVVKSPLLGA